MTPKSQKKAQQVIKTMLGEMAKSPPQSGVHEQSVQCPATKREAALFVSSDPNAIAAMRNLSEMTRYAPPQLIAEILEAVRQAVVNEVNKT